MKKRNIISKISFILASIVFVAYVFMTIPFNIGNIFSASTTNDLWVENIDVGELNDYEVGEGEYTETWVDISTAGELALLCQQINNDVQKYKGYNVRLTNNINLWQYYWTPIKSFTKTFDGNGFAISNMKIKSTSDSAGLFEKLEDSAIVTNLTLKDCSVHSVTKKASQIYIGFIAGYVNSPNIKISNCRVISTCIIDKVDTYQVIIPKGTEFLYFGGFVGRCSNSPSITNCFVSGTFDFNAINNNNNIKAWSAIGGFVGESNEFKIELCGADVEIKNINYLASIVCGGIVGMAYTTNISKCYNKQNITIGKTSSSSVNRIDAGGIAGVLSGGRIEHCYNTGSISGYVSGNTKSSEVIVDDLYGGQKLIFAPTTNDSLVVSGNFQEDDLGSITMDKYRDLVGEYEDALKGFSLNGYFKFYEKEKKGFSTAQRVSDYYLSGDCKVTPMSTNTLEGNLCLLGGIVGCLKNFGYKVPVYNCYSSGDVTDCTADSKYTYYTKIRRQTGFREYRDVVRPSMPSINSITIVTGKGTYLYNNDENDGIILLYGEANMGESAAAYEFLVEQTVVLTVDTSGPIYGYIISEQKAEYVIPNCYYAGDDDDTNRFNRKFKEYYQKYYHCASDTTKNEVTQYLENDETPLKIDKWESKRYLSETNTYLLNEMGPYLTYYGSPLFANESYYNADSRCNWWYLNQFEEIYYRMYWGVEWTGTETNGEINIYCMAYNEYDTEWWKTTKIWNYDETKTSVGTINFSSSYQVSKLDDCDKLVDVWEYGDSNINGGLPYLKDMYWQHSTTEPSKQQ